MKRFLKPFQMLFVLLTMVALSSCALGQAATPPTPTVDIEAIKTAAAATAVVELTKIAGQASPTLAPTQTYTPIPATETPTQEAGATQSAVEPTLDPALFPTATGGAAGLPVVETPNVPPMAGTPAPIPSATPLSPVVPGNTGPTCLNSKFVEDVTIPDGTVFKPGEKFTKVWRIQNTGTCPWDQGFGFILWAGPSMNATPQYFSSHDQKVQPGGVIDFYVDMRAPNQPGDYIAHWVMVSDSGKTFGGDFVVYIKVVK
jgi:hypothetical protein